jgi:hypothetical protein
VVLLMEKVLSLDGVEVIYWHDSDTFEVWALVADGPDDCMWDVVATVESSDEACAIAHEVWLKMETMV